MVLAQSMVENRVLPADFHSILFPEAEEGATEEAHQAPAFFTDLNLDQIVDAVTASRAEYNLKPFFYSPLKDVDAIEYRQEVMRDLENHALAETLRTFARKMRDMREHLGQGNKLYYEYQRERWFLETVAIYCDAVNDLAHDLSRQEIRSRGLVSFREYLANYIRSNPFTSLRSETKKLLADLSGIRYSLIIKGNTIKVRKYELEADYSAEVEETFAKFKQGAVKDYRAKFSTWPDMNHVEARVLEFVARLHPEVFSALDDYCARNTDYLDRSISVFDREIQFYLAYLEYIASIKHTGLKFCYPQVADRSKQVYDYEGFDLALADKFLQTNSDIVTNDFYLKDPERVFVITGPNQGGKTTFARTFGQLHYLASLGCPVPGREAKLFLFDQLFTHFEKEENIENLRGKLEDDLVRIHEILSLATPNSIVIMNEIFTSTTLEDALFLSKEVLGRIIDLDLLCVCVTFMDELASMSEKTVSLVSTVVPENPTQRTFKIVRRPADGLAYALSLAEKHGLTYAHLKERIPA